MKFEQNTTQIKKQETLYPFVFIDNVLDESQIKDLDAAANQFGFSVAQTGANENSVSNEYLRRSKISWLDTEKLPKEVLIHFQNIILDINKQRYNFDLLGFEALQYTVYEESNAGEYKWHTDTMQLPDGNVRKLSLSVLLSDPSEFEGGKLILNVDGNLVVAEERKGRAFFFPSWMLHCVTPVTKGTRKSLVIWTHGPMFK